MLAVPTAACRIHCPQPSFHILIICAALLTCTAMSTHHYDTPCAVCGTGADGFCRRCTKRVLPRCGGCRTAVLLYCYSSISFGTQEAVKGSTQYVQQQGRNCWVCRLSKTLRRRGEIVSCQTIACRSIPKHLGGCRVTPSQGVGFVLCF